MFYFLSFSAGGLSLFLLHFSPQYFTFSHSFSHFLRHVKGFWQVRQIFVGKCCFFIAADIGYNYGDIYSDLGAARRPSVALPSVVLGASRAQFIGRQHANN